MNSKLGYKLLLVGLENGSVIKKVDFLNREALQNQFPLLFVPFSTFNLLALLLTKERRKLFRESVHKKKNIERKVCTQGTPATYVALWHWGLKKAQGTTVTTTEVVYTVFFGDEK